MCCTCTQPSLPQAVARGHVRRPKISPAMGYSMLRPCCGGLQRAVWSRAQEKPQSSKECVNYLGNHLLPSRRDPFVDQQNVTCREPRPSTSTADTGLLSILGTMLAILASVSILYVVRASYFYRCCAPCQSSYFFSCKCCIVSGCGAPTGKIYPRSCKLICSSVAILVPDGHINLALFSKYRVGQHDQRRTNFVMTIYCQLFLLASSVRVICSFVWNGVVP